MRHHGLASDLRLLGARLFSSIRQPACRPRLAARVKPCSTSRLSQLQTKCDGLPTNFANARPIKLGESFATATLSITPGPLLVLGYRLKRFGISMRPGTTP